MKKLLLFISLIASSVAVVAQVEPQTFTDEEILGANLGALDKARTLYAYEFLAWHGSDNISKYDLSPTGYIVIENDDNSMSIVFYDETVENCLISQRLNLKGELEEPDATKRPLTEKELQLITMKRNLILLVLNRSEFYDITCPEDCNLNFIFLPTETGYELFITLGTSAQNIIPLGGDFMFIVDKEGNIENWCKFHQGTFCFPLEKKLLGLEHSHVKYPFISPTEICVFMLYAPYFGIDELTIHSPRINKKFIYNMKKHDIITKRFSNI